MAFIFHFDVVFYDSLYDPNFNFITDTSGYICDNISLYYLSL
jgi:hypothetical protein